MAKSRAVQGAASDDNEKLLASSNDIEMSQDNRQNLYDETVKSRRAIESSNIRNYMNYIDTGDDDEEDDDFDEETRFVTRNRDSFYTSTERT